MKKTHTYITTLRTEGTRAKVVACHTNLKWAYEAAMAYLTKAEIKEDVSYYKVLDSIKRTGKVYLGFVEEQATPDTDRKIGTIKIDKVPILSRECEL